MQGAKGQTRGKEGGASELKQTSALVVYTRAKVRGKVVVVEGTTCAAVLVAPNSGLVPTGPELQLVSDLLTKT